MYKRQHKQICKKIHRGGNAEQYYADKKYKEAVAVAVEKCADDTKGQTCFICTQALHWKTKEGLVRGCSCRGTAGFAHVSCLAEQAQILFAEVIYAQSLFHDNGAAVDDLREAVAMIEDSAQIARRVFGGSHPLTIWVEGVLVHARMALRIRQLFPLVFAFAVAAFAWVWRKYRS